MELLLGDPNVCAAFAAVAATTRRSLKIHQPIMTRHITARVPPIPIPTPALSQRPLLVPSEEIGEVDVDGTAVAMTGENTPPPMVDKRVEATTVADICGDGPPSMMLKKPEAAA